MDSMSVGRYAPCYYIDMESKTLTRGTYDFSAPMEKRAKMAEEEARNPQIGRETLSRQELEDMAAKYDPSHMSQETYNAFIRDLLDQGVLGKSETYDIGLDRVVANMAAQGLGQIVVSAPTSVYYLTGLYVEPMERMLALLIRDDGSCTLYANELFALPPQPDLPIKLHTDSDDPAAILAADLRPGKLGVRVEDLVLVTEGGCEVLNNYPKGIQIVE